MKPKTVNRQALWIRHGPRFDQWLRKQLADVPGAELNSATLNSRPTLYLVDLQEDDLALDGWVQAHASRLLGALFAEWCPEARSLPSPEDPFDGWIEVFPFDMVKDLGLAPLEPDLF